MWLVYFASVLQFLLIAERVLNRIVCLFVLTRRSETKKLADNSVVGVLFSTLLTYLTLPIQMVTIFAQLILSNVYMFTALLFVAGFVIVVNDNAQQFLVNFVNTYNSGIGQTVNAFVQQLSIVDLVFRSFVPLWNGLVWFVTQWVWHVFMPFVNGESAALPAIIESLTLCVGSFGLAVQTWITNLVTCVGGSGGGGMLGANVTVPFTQPGLQCIGDANYLMLDLVTPGTYFVQVLRTTQDVMTATCAPVMMLVELGTYPLIDFNLHKAIHSLVNFVLHIFVGLPVTTYQRCQYGKRGDFTAIEKRVMCTPDFAVSNALLVTFYESLGRVLDNWLNVALALVEGAFFGEVTGCVTHSPVKSLSLNASTFLSSGLENFKVVGMTHQMIALTDGLTTAYHTLTDTQYTEWAIGNWPFRINPQYGVAAVKHGETYDGDVDGDLRTGLFGCECYDVPTGSIGLTRMEVWCASVPYTQFTDNETAYNASTIHRTNFYSSRTAGYMTCAKTRIKVSSLRFSRKRFSAGHFGGVEGGFLDPYNTLGMNGRVEPRSFAADAAVHVQPMCDNTDASCVPDIENCFPWCMGLHMAGMTASNITLYNARTWEETVSVGQIDCVVNSGQLQQCDGGDGTQVISPDFGLDQPGPCFSDDPLCMPDDNSQTLIRLEALANNSLVQHKQSVHPVVRSSKQPFVIAGDVMLHISDCRLVVSRLYDDNKGQFTLDREMLTMSSNWNSPIIHFDDPTQKECMEDFSCDTESDPTCYSQAVKDGRFVLPRSYFATTPVETPVAASEWAVHWAVNPENSVFQAQFEWCNRGARLSGAIVSTSYARPRIWTMKTVRAVDTVNFGIQDTSSMSYMVVPDWLEWREDPETVDCHNMVNLKVLDLEYINENNILVTVLTAPPSSYNHNTDGWPICDGCPYEFTYYYLHPTRQDCIEPSESTEQHFSCWRRESEGMFVATESAVSSVVGELCPQMQRMPELGAASAALASASARALKMVVDLIAVAPAAMGDFAAIFQTRLQRITFHSVLDSSGSSLFNIEPVINDIERASMLAAHTLPKLGHFFQGTAEYEYMQPVLLGTAKILQHSATPLNGVLLSQFNMLSKFPATSALNGRRLLQRTVQTGRRGSPQQATSWKRRGANMIVSVIRGTMSAFANSLKAMGRGIKRVIHKVLTSSLSLHTNLLLRDFARQQIQNQVRATVVSGRVIQAVLPVAAVTSADTLLFSTVYESQHDIRRTFTDNVRTQCHGLAQIFGTGLPWGDVAKHSCMLIADSSESILQAFMVVTMDYLVTDCVCKSTEEGNVLEVIERRCLPKFLPISLRAWVLDRLRDESNDVLSHCFVVMDAANERLERAFDPIFRRFELIAPAMARSVDYAMKLFDVDAGNCDKFTLNPYVVTIIPEPTNWFMGCADTNMCKMRCFDTYTAFEEALASQSVKPSLDQEVEVVVESRFFKETDIENGLHRPAFDLYGMTELPSSVCQTVCASTHTLNRCIGITGLERDTEAKRLRTGYYCVPANFMLPMFEYSITQNAELFTEYNDAVLQSYEIMHVEFVTHDGVTRGERDDILVTARNPFDNVMVMWLFPASGEPFEVLRTIVQTDIISEDVPQINTLHEVRVVPATDEDAARVFVIGGKIRADDTVQDVCLMFPFYPSVRHEAMRVDTALHNMENCTEHMDDIYSAEYKFVCVGEDCSRVLKIPYRGTEDSLIEEFEWNRFYLNRVPQTTHYHTADASVVNSISNVFNIQPDYRLSSLLNGERILNDKFVSAYCPKGMQTDTTGVESVSILIADRLTDRQWLHNAQITLPADTFGATLASSIPVPQTLRYMDECSVDNCMACQVPSRPHLYRDVQHKCYAAAQCAMQNCVGLEVNMRKPLCNIGKILAGQIHAASASGQAAWMALSHTIITVMEITHKRREQYSVLWPHETFVMGVCNMKDDIIATMATLTSTVTWFVDLNSPVKVTDDDEVLDPRANGLHTMLMMSVTELSTAVGLFPVYIAIALENSFQCQYSNLMVVVEQNRQIIAGPDTTGFDLTITNWETRERSIEVAGVCMMEFSRGRMADIAKGSNKDSAALVAKSVLSSVMDITMSSRFDPIMSLLSSMLTYLEGIANGLLKVLQVYDWNDCKLDVISVEHKALCVCGDKAARIPQHQRQALDPTGTPGLNPNLTPVRPHALWCMGPLMLTAVDGSDVLVWNPYTFDELLAEEHSRYLECRTSWIHMTLMETVEKAKELTTQDIEAVADEFTYEQLLRDYASLDLPSKLQTITHHVFQFNRLSNRCSLRLDSDVTWEVVEDPDDFGNIEVGDDPGDFAANVGARRRLLIYPLVAAGIGIHHALTKDNNVYSTVSCIEEVYDEKTASQHLKVAEDLFTTTVLNEIKYAASYDTQLRIAKLVFQEFDKQREAQVSSVQKELDAIDAQNRQYEIDYKNAGYQFCNVDADCNYIGCASDALTTFLNTVSLSTNQDEDYQCLFNKCGKWPNRNFIEDIFTSLVASDFKLCPPKQLNADPFFEYDPVEVNNTITDYFKTLISDITLLLNKASLTTISTAIQNKCSNLKVEMPLLTDQGVETMQVITRCRSNYQQKKWDEGSLLFGLFTEAEWQDALPAWGGTPDLAVSMPTMQRYYNKFKRISEIPGMDVSVDMDSSTHQCLYYSLQSQTWGHDCLRRYLISSPYGQKYEMTQADAYFMYEPHQSSSVFFGLIKTEERQSFTSVDACQTYSGDMDEYESEFNNSYPKFVWSGDSTNMVPVATMHTMSTGGQSFREDEAKKRLNNLLKNIIEPALEKIPANLSNQIEIRAWSVEGDEIHQLVDCVMLGPYSAADMHSTFEMSNAERFPVPQYHRGDPSSRLFVNDGTAETKGSEARREIMAAAQQHVSNLYDSTITEEAKNTLHQIKTMFRDISNMQCLCPGSEPPSLSCCQNADKLGDINFRLKTLFQDVWAVTNYHNVTMTSLMNSNILRDDLWSTDEFTYASSYVFTDEDKQQLQHHYVFNNSAPIMSYSVDEVPSSFTQETLWSTCMDLLSTPFFTLPVRPTTGNDTSLHVDADMQYDPATETSTGYLHGMERAIEKILERARDDSPVFWTNVHRYVPSDSAWCEDLQASPTPTTTSRANIYTPATINNITLQPDIIYSQQLNETVFIGHITSHCLCNWHNGAACVVPNCYEVAVSAELNARWQELCTRGTYTSRADLLLFMQVLDETSVFDTAWLDAPPAPLLRCDTLIPSTSWGLLDTKLHADWYNQTENTQHISVHELATSGPAGLRLGLLSEGPNTLHDFVTKHKLTSQSPDAKMINYQYQHTIAQPHCHNQRQQFLHANLSLYFRDVFFPMAHSIHEAPITSYCSTWAIEYAMEQTLKQILPFNDNTLVEQQERTSKWKSRCDVQLQQMGICLLRGVYDIVPVNTFVQSVVGIAVVAQDDASFDRTQRDKIDVGPITWNIADNGGFTAVMKVKFEGDPADGSWSAVFQFGGSGDTDRIVLGQHGSLNEVQWTIRDSTQQCYNSRYDHDDYDGSGVKVLSITYGSWHTIVTRWRASDFQSFISVDGVTRTRTCPLVTIPNFASDGNIIGNRCCDNWDVKHFNGQLAGFYAFDRYLDETEVALVADNIKIPFDMSTAVVAQDDASFDRTQLDKIDVGPKTWNIADNGGFTAVMKVKFEGDPADGSYQQLFRFDDGTSRISLDQHHVNSDLRWILHYPNQPEGTSVWCVISNIVGSITYNTWHTVVMKWHDSDKLLYGSVDNTFQHVGTCTNYIFPNFVTNPTWIGGMDRVEPRLHFNGQMAGFYAFDRYLDETEVALVADNIKIPFDMSTAVVAQDDASFDRTQLNQIDFGPTTWNIASNGGLTIVTKVYPTSNFVAWEDIFKAKRLRTTGTAETWDVLLFIHTFRIFSNNWQRCDVSYPSLARNTWTTLIARYNKAENTMSVNIDPPTSDGTTFRTYDCDDNTEVFEVGSFTATETSIGGDGVDPTNFNGQIAGLYAFDRYLDDTEVALVAANIRIGVDAGQNNLARSCGATQDQQCPTAASSFAPSYPASKINNNHFGTHDVWISDWGITETAATIYIYVDLEHSADINLVRLYPRESQSVRMNGVEVRVGDNAADPWSNTICGSITTWTSGDSSTDVHCTGTGRYVFLTWSSLYNGVGNLNEMQVFAQATDVSATDGTDVRLPDQFHRSVQIPIVPEHCLFTLGNSHGCTSSVFYVTSHCLVMCDGQFYAPAQDNGVFTKAGSTPIVDPRTFADHPAVKLYSMHWPSRIEENEVAGEPHLAELDTQALNAELQTIQARLQDVNFEDESLYRNVQHLIELQEVSTDMEGEAPDAYCDDLLDYFDGTVQHPVGYHPTTGCDASTTNMRGFDSWMSKGMQYAWNVDPVRLRNMTKYSSTFGTSHLVCDAGVYGALDYSLNPYFLQTRWDPLQKADPAVPYEPETIDVESMSLFGLPSYDAFDTPIQTEENFMRHSVGLIRDWLRWYGDDPELQAKLDASWPNWVRCPPEEIDCETYGIDTDTAMDQCTLPPLLTCLQDSDCVSGNATHDLVCLANNHDENNEGICAKRNTCYQHAHCPDDMLCSGAGTCVEPRIFIRNRLDATISAQMFAESNPSCSQSMNGMSQFQNIPDFAHANGMCSFRNWMHYTNLTRDAELQPDGLLHIKNHRKRFSNSDVAQDLYHELNVLRPYVSGCDRSYQHTDYHYCSPHHIPARRGYGEGLEKLCADEDEDNACYMKATKTWMHTTDTSSNLTARFCDLYTDYTSHTAFLSPYTYVNEEGDEQDTLEHVPETLKRCYDFEICPTVRFLVEGRGVHKRRVLMVDRDDPNDSSDPFVLQDRMRSYLHSDADECFGVGYHVQGKTLCVVDRYTLPLIDAVFNTDAQLQVEHVPIDTYSSTSNPRWNADYIHDLFVKLREGTGGFAKCPRAFSRVMNGMQNEALFTEFLKVLTRTYKTSARQQVTQYANALLPALFGIDAQTGEGRGLNNIDDYIAHAACMDWISTALQEAKELARRPDEMPYVVESIYPDKTPGTSLYVFHERSAVALNITWFWQCVVLSEPGEDGGVTNQWLEKLTNPTSDEPLECNNFDEDVTDDISLTMKKRLQTAGGKGGALFKMFEQTTDAGTVDVVADVRQVIQFALNELRLGSTPHVYCMKSYTLRDTQTPWYVNSSCANVFHEAQNQVPPLSSCWEKYGLDLGMVGGQLVDFTDDIDVSSTNMAVRAEELLLGSRMAVDQTFAFTLENLIERGFIKERDHELLNKVDGTDDFFPVYFFAYLENDLDPPPVQSFLHDSIASDMFTINNYATLDQNEGSACRGDLSLRDVTVFQLTSPEFEVQDDGFVEATRGYTLQDDNNASLIGRRYLTQDQALFLLMRVIKREIYNTFSFRENNLYLDTFASQLAFPDFGIDMASQLTAAKEYNEFMAQKSFACSDDQEMLLYAETNTVHKRMRDCVNRLQEDIGWKIDTNEILQLYMPTHVVKAGFYPAYTEHSTDKFLDDITSSKWTTEQYVSAQDLVCYKTRTGNAEPLNPLWAGGYDVLTCPQGVSCGCDTTAGIGDTRFVDASCRKRDDEQCSDLFPDFARASIPLSCQTLSAQYQSVTLPRMGSIRADETPLCQRTPSLDATTCSRRFGTLHGNPGFVPGSILYTTPFSRGGVVQRGLWGGSNSIFRGQRHERFLPEITPAIQLLSRDIAGHALEFEIEPNGNLYLRCVSMLPVESQDSSFQERFPSPPSNECTIPSGEWMKNLESSWLWQHNTLKSEWPTQTVTSPSVSWKCPLQRIAAYSNHSKAFSALTPSRDRNKVRFEHITENSHFAHPTVSSIDVMPHLKPARFIADNLACATYDVNGRAFCHGKNLLDFSLNSLLTYTDTWSQFTLVEPSNKCNQMLDWPHQSFTTRDQKTVRSEYTERCNVLHRLPSFGVKATRLENVFSKGTSSASTSPGGVCHMQQLPHLQPWSEVCAENNIPCNTQSKNAVQTCVDQGDRLFCRYLFNQEIVSGSESTFSLLDKIIQIRKLAPYQATRQPTRRAQRCSQCAANHGTNTSGFQGGFVNRSGANDPLPASPLMSVGMPMRLSTERMLARYLRKIVCPHASEEPCAELLAIFNTEAWTTGQFLRSFMAANDTAGLLKQWDVSKQDTFDHTLFGTNYTDDAALWSRNWVFCDQATTNNAGCNGSISKTEWLDPHARPDACRRAILDSKTTESLPVHFCLLDKNTERLCQYVVEWTDEITSILCKAAGLPECPETDFFYTPTTYAIENREFVSETVLGFYNSIDDSVCAASLTDTEIQAQALSNAIQKQKCDAVPVAVTKSIIQKIHESIRNLYRLIYHTFSATTYFGLTIISMIENNNVGFFFTRFKFHFFMVIQSFFEMIYKFIITVLSHIPGMKFLVDAICIILKILKVAFCAMLRGMQVGSEFAETVTSHLNTAREVMWTYSPMGMITTAAGGDDTVGKFMKKGLSQYLIDEMGDEYSGIENIFTIPKVFFRDAADFVCNFDTCPEFDFKENPENSTLPSPTRCWPSYQTFFGDNQQLSCTAADTCRLSLTSTDTSLGYADADQMVPCGQCTAMSTGFDDYGCDALTKLCTCSVPRYSTTQCLSNDECQASSATCNYIDSEFQLLPTPTDCAVCTSQKVCYMEPGAEIGTCACGLTSIPFSQCLPETQGKVVIPHPDKMCLYETERRFSDMSRSQSTFSHSLSVSCADMNQLSARCLYVTDFRGYFIVNQPGFSGRRLLGMTVEEKDNIDSSITQSPVCRDALHPDNRMALFHAREECIRAYMTSMDTIRTIKMEGKLKPCTFCSVEDFKHEAKNNPMFLVSIAVKPELWLSISTKHGPGRHIASIYKTAKQLHDVIMKDLRTPSVIKTRLPTNHTIHNATHSETSANFSHNTPTLNRRRLLTYTDIVNSIQQEFEAATSMHQSFASQFASTYDYSFPDLTDTQQTIWFQDWPPTYDSSSSNCNIFSNTLTLAQWAIGNATLPFTPAGRALQATPASRLRDAWPRINTTNVTVQDDGEEEDILVDWFTWAVRKALSWVSLDSHSLYDLFSAMTSEILSATTCDYQAIQTCSKWYVTLSTGFIVTAVYFSVWFLLCSVFQLTFIAAMTMPLFTIVLMWVCYGYSPFCFPLIPVCAMRDLHDSLNMVFPRYMRLPLSLAPNCPNTGIAGGAPLYNNSCVQDCRLPPFEYTSWHAVVAWTTAEFGPDAVQWSLDNTDTIPFIDHDLLRLQLEIKDKMMQDDNYDLVAGNRVCALLSSYQVMPYLLIVVVVFLAFVTVVRTLFLAIAPLTQLVATTYVSIFVQDWGEKEHQD